jgi:hypothetical protein
MGTQVPAALPIRVSSVVGASGSVFSVELDGGVHALTNMVTAIHNQTGILFTNIVDAFNIVFIFT